MPLDTVNYNEIIGLISTSNMRVNSLSTEVFTGQDYGKGAEAVRQVLCKKRHSAKFRKIHKKTPPMKYE